MSEKAEKREGEQASKRNSEEAAEPAVAETLGRYNATTPAEGIAALVAGLAPIDWVQLRLTARLSPGQRIRSAMEARAFAIAGLRATFRRRFPELSETELNLRVLAYLTPVRLPNEEKP